MAERNPLMGVVASVAGGLSVVAIAGGVVMYAKLEVVISRIDTMQADKTAIVELKKTDSKHWRILSHHRDAWNQRIQVVNQRHPDDDQIPLISWPPELTADTSD
jgi:hypothetical protein